MRGSSERLGPMFVYVTTEQFVPKKHPLRSLKPLVDTALSKLDREFDALYASTGRPSNRIKQAQSEYDKAYGKFVDGRGNVIRQAEMLKGLGVKPGKSMPTDVLDAAMEEPSLLSND